jgi:hypothetical protein
LKVRPAPERHQRTREAASCAELAEATALIVALLIDARAVTTVPTPVSPLPRVEANSPAARDTAASSFRLGLHGAAGLGRRMVAPQARKHGDDERAVLQRAAHPRRFSGARIEIARQVRLLILPRRHDLLQGTALHPVPMQVHGDWNPS